MMRKNLSSCFCCNNNNNNNDRTKVWEQVLTSNKPFEEDCKVTKTKTIIKISHVCAISYFIAYQLLLNHAQVVFSCSCWNIYHENEVPEAEGLSSEREQSVRVSCKSLHKWWSLSQTRFYSFSLSFLRLTSGLSWLLEKVCYPTHWTSLTPFPTLLHLLSPSFPSLLLFQECQTPIQTLCSKHFFLPDGRSCPAALPLAMEGER